MGAFDTLRLRGPCASCRRDVDLEIQFKYGDTWQLEYRIGDTLRWGGNDIGVPNAAKVVVDGVAEACPACGFEGDFEIFVENGILASARPASGSYDFVAAGETFLELDRDPGPPLIPTNDEILDLWGLQRVTWSPLEVPFLADEDREILLRLGLPAHVDWTLDFSRAARLPPDQAGDWVLGEDGGVPLTLSLSSRDVWCREDLALPGGKPKFVNQSLLQFAQSLAIYQAYRLAVRKTTSEAAALRCCLQAEARLRASDSRAMEDPDFYWPAVCEQMRDGLL